MKCQLQRMIIILILFSFHSADAQRDSIRRYLDGSFRLCSKANAVYGGMQIREESGWKFFAVYPDTALLIQMSFKDKNLRIKDGPFTVYYDKRGPAQMGNYVNDQLDGEWRIWYGNRQLKQQGQLKLGQATGVWKNWLENGQLQSEIVYTSPDTVLPVVQAGDELPWEKSLVEHREPTGEMLSRSTWFANGNKESEVHFAGNKLEGYSLWYRENGQPATRELYKDGKLESLECYNDSGRLTGSTCSIAKLPVFVHPVFDVLDFIEFELHKKKEKFEEGYVRVKYRITKEGKLTSLVVYVSPDPKLSDRIREIFAKMPQWSPAVVHNRAIDYDLTLDIPYFRN